MPIRPNTSGGNINETDPIFNASPAKDLSTADLTNLRNQSGTNTGDQDLSPYAKIKPIRLQAPATALSWGYRQSAPQTYLLDIGAELPNGIKITSIKVTCNKADPAVELSAQVKSADINTTGAFPATNISTIATVNTTTGNYSQTGMTTTVATNKRLYLETTADVYDTGTVWFLEIVYEVL